MKICILIMYTVYILVIKFTLATSLPYKFILIPPHQTFSVTPLDIDNDA